MAHAQRCGVPVSIANSAGILVTDGSLTQTAGPACFGEHVFGGFHSFLGGLFEGRQGFKGRTHLVSPKMAAAAALVGHFVDTRTWKPGA